MVLKATDVPADAAKPYAFSTFMNTAAAVAELRETATVDRVGMRPAQRLADIHALFAEEMGWVDAELRLLAATGVTPATDSARHLLEAGGKRVRPLAVLLAAGCFGEIPEAARHVAAVSELIHLATLLHDDVIDDAPVRRGKPTARTLWGNAVSVLAGDLLLTHALERTSRVAPGSVLVELFATLRKLVDGEVVQLRGRTEIDVRPATYFAIVRDKTASLFVWATRSGAAIAGAPKEAVDALGAYGEHIGTAFQLVDDLLDYAGEGTGKALFTDLGEGKITLPLLLAIEREPGTGPRRRASSRPCTPMGPAMPCASPRRARPRRGSRRSPSCQLRARAICSRPSRQSSRRARLEIVGHRPPGLR
jgi:octaprenyl-diphosphate synthase